MALCHRPIRLSDRWGLDFDLSDRQSCAVDSLSNFRRRVQFVDCSNSKAIANRPMAPTHVAHLVYLLLASDSRLAVYEFGWRGLCLPIFHRDLCVAGYRTHEGASVSTAKICARGFRYGESGQHRQYAGYHLWK